MKPVDPDKARRYRDRSDACFHAMRLLGEDLPSYADAVALLAIHSAIALADAIHAACSGQRPRDPDHRSAVGELRKLCGKMKRNPHGIDHFAWLIKEKTDFSYGERRLLPKDIKDAMIKVERFHTWAYRQFPDELGRSEDHDAGVS